MSISLHQVKALVLLGKFDEAIRHAEELGAVFAPKDWADLAQKAHGASQLTAAARAAAKAGDELPTPMRASLLQAALDNSSAADIAAIELACQMKATGSQWAKRAARLLWNGDLKEAHESDAFSSKPLSFRSWRKAVKTRIYQGDTRVGIILTLIGLLKIGLTFSEWRKLFKTCNAIDKKNGAETKHALAAAKLMFAPQTLPAVMKGVSGRSWMGMLLAYKDYALEQIAIPALAAMSPKITTTDWLSAFALCASGELRTNFGLAMQLVKASGIKPAQDQLQLIKLRIIAADNACELPGRLKELRDTCGAKITIDDWKIAKAQALAFPYNSFEYLSRVLEYGGLKASESDRREWIATYAADGRYADAIAVADMQGRDKIAISDTQWGQIVSALIRGELRQYMIHFSAAMMIDLRNKVKERGERIPGAQWDEIVAFLTVKKADAGFIAIALEEQALAT